MKQPNSEVVGQNAQRADGQPQATSLIDLATILLRDARTVFLITILVTVVGVGLAALRTNYVASSRLAPDTGGDITRFAGIAAQLGISMPGSGGGTSVSFYSHLLKTNGLLAEAVQSRYRFSPDTESQDTIEGSLVELYEIGEEDPRKRLGKAVARLEKNVSVSTDIEAGVITLMTAAPWPELAEQINRRLLVLLEEFDLGKRQTQAAAERAFIETRLRESGRELKAAEDALEAFLEANRTYEASPALRFQAGRLEREIGLQQQVYATLAQALEQARIEEVRNTPVITVVDDPHNSARPEGMGLVPVGLVSLLVGAVLGCVAVFVRSYVRQERERKPQAFEAFDELRNSMRSRIDPRRRRRPPDSHGVGRSAPTSSSERIPGR